MHDTVAFGDAGAARAVHADRMDFIDIGHGAILLGEVADLAERGDVAVHRIKALARDQDRPTGMSAEQLLEMGHIVVAEHDAFAAGLADALDHRIVVERVRQDQAVRNELGERRDTGLVRHVAGGEHQRRFLAVKVGELLLELDQGMVVASDVAGAACAGAGAGRGLDHGADHLGVLAHAEIVVGAPHHDAAFALGGVPGRKREPTGDAFEICEHPVAPLIVQPIEGVVEELIVIHTKTPLDPWTRKRPRKGRLFSDAFLERFQLQCRGSNREAALPGAQNVADRRWDRLARNQIARLDPVAWPSVRTSSKRDLMPSRSSRAASLSVCGFLVVSRTSPMKIELAPARKHSACISSVMY